MNLIRSFSGQPAARFFLLAGGIAGLLLLLLTPPFQAPDEVNHFYRAWQVSEGQWAPLKENERLGGYVPESVRQFTQPFLKLRFDPSTRTSRSAILAAGNIPLQPEQKVFVDFPNTAFYSPVCYAPQAFAIFVLRKMNATPLQIYYLQRAAVFLCWLLIVFAALRTLPGMKWLFTLLALLPMSVFINCSTSADTLTNAVAFYFLAFVLKCATQKEQLKRAAFFILLLLSAGIALVKPGYTPLLLLLFLLPRSIFASRKMYAINILLLLLPAIVITIVWSAAYGKLYTPYEAYNPAFRNGIDLNLGANAAEQLARLKAHPGIAVSVFVHSVAGNAQQFSGSYIGKLGWMDTAIPVWFILLAWAMIATTIFFDSEKIPLRKSQVLLLAVTLLLLLGLIIFSQYLTWEPVGAARDTILQGRYFHPGIPAAFPRAAGGSCKKTQEDGTAGFTVQHDRARHYVSDRLLPVLRLIRKNSGRQFIRARLANIF